MLKMKGINEPPQEEDGFRILIDESWPKGLSKDEANVDLWLEEIKSPKGLDEWLEEDLMYLENIEGKNNAEIQNKKTLIKIIRDTEKEKGTVTFIYSTIKSLTQLQV